MKFCKTGPRKYTKAIKEEPSVASVDSTDSEFVQKISMAHKGYSDAAIEMIETIDVGEIMNLKELRAFAKMTSPDRIPIDIFNVVCNNIVEQMLAPDKMVHALFRDALYDIFVYNLDVVECLWHILCNLIENGHLKGEAISEIVTRSYTFLKYYNNNYRPIYHLESMFHYMIIKINGTDELPARF
jgi:hypothetical protein